MKIPFGVDGLLLSYVRGRSISVALGPLVEAVEYCSVDDVSPPSPAIVLDAVLLAVNGADGCVGISAGGRASSIIFCSYSFAYPLCFSRLYFPCSAKKV